MPIDDNPHYWFPSGTVTESTATFHQELELVLWRSGGQSYPVHKEELGALLPRRMVSPKLGQKGQEGGKEDRQRGQPGEEGLKK